MFLSVALMCGLSGVNSPPNTPITNGCVFDYSVTIFQTEEACMGMLSDYYEAVKSAKASGQLPEGAYISDMKCVSMGGPDPKEGA